MLLLQLPKIPGVPCPLVLERAPTSRQFGLHVAAVPNLPVQRALQLGDLRFARLQGRPGRVELPRVQFIGGLGDIEALGEVGKSLALGGGCALQLSALPKAVLQRVVQLRVGKLQLQLDRLAKFRKQIEQFML
jgi:hypothetical protein